MDKKSNILYLENVTKSFGQGEQRVDALSKVDLEVSAGSFTAVMGASGSGKSTLLHLIAGLTRPNDGQVVISGEDLWQLPEWKRTKIRREKIGFVFQSFNLISALTARENVTLPKVSAGQRFQDQELKELMTDLGIIDRQYHLPGTLSGGEQQRVAIARAVFSGADIILADEPTGSLDSKNADSICRLLRKICDEQKKTVMVVTHEPNVAKWADSILVLKDGRIMDQFETTNFASSSNIASHYMNLVG